MRERVNVETKVRVRENKKWKRIKYNFLVYNWAIVPSYI